MMFGGKLTTLATTAGDILFCVIICTCILKHKQVGRNLQATTIYHGCHNPTWVYNGPHLTLTTLDNIWCPDKQAA